MNYRTSGGAVVLLFGLGAMIRGYVIKDPNAQWGPYFVIGAVACVILGLYLLYTGQKEGKKE